MNILFFHHAGSDRYAFTAYQPFLQEQGWTGIVYELPGHGDRYSEPLLHDIDAVMEDAYDRLHPFLAGDYAIFGNSMGSLLGYLLMHRAMDRGLPLPQHFFAVSRKCPASYADNRLARPMSDGEFWEMIRGYGGSVDVLEHPEMRKFYEPLLRADFNILQSYEHRPRPVLAVPATVIYGRKDRYTPEEMETWRQHFLTTEILPLEGGHFLATEQVETMTDLLLKKLG